MNILGVKDEAVDASCGVVTELTFEDGIARLLMRHSHVLEETCLLLGSVRHRVASMHGKDMVLAEQVLESNLDIEWRMLTTRLGSGSCSQSM